MLAWLTVPTLLAATSQSLHALIIWRFLQGIFGPGVIVVIMAYINQEFPAFYVGRAMAAYVTGTVLGGFLGRFISGLAAHHFDWRVSFLAIGVLNLAGAIVVQRALPRAKNFVRASSWRHSVAEGTDHLRNVRLLAIFGMGFAALFCLVGVFTYANSYLANPPFRLNSAQLGSVFFVYLLGLIGTPLSGRFLDRFGIRRTGLLVFVIALVGLTLTIIQNLPMIIARLALLSSGIFIFQAVGTVQTGIVAQRARSLAAGLYVTFYYVGGSLGAIVTGWTWLADGWRACVFLLMGVAGIALALAYASSTTTAAGR
jgi:predicted MFS family arabinose efflux permease